MQAIACQLDIVWEDKPANHAKVRALLNGVDVQPGALIVLPEMFATGFSMNVAGIDEGEDKPSQCFVTELATTYRGTVIAGVVNTTPTGRGLNEAIAIGPDGGEVARYRKMQPFSPGHENEHYEPGDEPVTFALGPFTVALFVCYDLRFPELFRIAARRGADLLVVIANWPIARVEHWLTLLRARAIENQAYMIGVNRAGRDPTLEYSGRSLIVDPQGNVLADAGDRESAATATLDADVLREYRTRLPFLADMRDDLIADRPLVRHDRAD